MKLEIHKDKRGTIKDLMVGKDFSITHITFKKGAIRGNHYHKETEQTDIILKGKLLCSEKKGSEEILKKGDDIWFLRRTPHAYKALEDSEMVSICIGKRIGKNYAKDTYKCELIS